MFRADYIKQLHLHYPKASFITVRANKDGLQYCIFQKDKKTGGLRILNEGNEKIGVVLGFKLEH